jgi:hypothetical protein
MILRSAERGRLACELRGVRRESPAVAGTAWLSGFPWQCACEVAVNGHGYLASISHVPELCESDWLELVVALKGPIEQLGHDH